MLSKGHAAPILYAAWAIAGFVDPAELLKLRKFDSDLEGHPTPKYFVSFKKASFRGCRYRISWIGTFRSWRHGLFLEISRQDRQQILGRYWRWRVCREAANLASYYKLDNLTAILDINRLGQSQETSIGHDIEVYKK